MKKIAIASLVLLLSIPLFSKEFITIGTGGVTGVYYPTGAAICRLLNNSDKDKKASQKHNIRCSVESTGGSVYNINTIRAGELDMGIAQSDWQYHAYKGTSKFAKKGPFKKLRAVFSVHPESLTILARKDSGIKKLNDLKGKRVNIGNPGSGTRGTMEAIMKAKGWTKKTFKVASELKSSEQSKALCDNKVDAIAFVAGHPSGSIKEAATTCETQLVRVSGRAINKLIRKNDYYRSAVIPAGMYKGSPKKTKTFGLAATFVTSSDASEEAVYNVVKAVFENFESFKKLHPAFANLKKSEMVKDGLSAPLHRGALKYYKEAGLIK
jgi:TRAP transporter TAXI family solute receptor